MSNPYGFIGLPLGSQASGTNAAGAMNMGHNLALGNLPFPGLMQPGGGQAATAAALHGLPFIQQAMGLGLGGMMPGQRLRVPEGIPRSAAQDPDVILDNTLVNSRQEPSRKRAKPSGYGGDSDDDIMVLSNSPNGGSEAGEPRDKAHSQHSGVWDNPTMPMNLGFPLGNPAALQPQLVNGTMYPADASSFMAAIGTQLPFDFTGLIPGVMANMPGPTKEPIHLKSCTLLPPNPQAPLPTTRERPLGCKTVFVGGLADNVTEEVLREIFERCGTILTIRMSKKNFAHVRFERESCVDSAIQLSGYRIRLNSQKGPEPSTSGSAGTSSGRLHVDFAQARDDQYEFECQARRMEREMRHRQRIEEDKWRPPSPPPVPHYAEHEAHVVVEQLKNEERFGRAVQILATWLERGDCSKRNSNAFYSMIQSAHAHLRRLGTEKGQLEEEARRTHDTLRQKFHHITSQLGEMERLFQAASHQKAWDHFTKAQRKSLESWRKHVTDLKSEPTVEFLTGSKNEDNMEFSDSESDEPSRRYKGPAEKNIAHLREENDSLRCQLEAYKNEVEIVRSDLKMELQAKEQQIKSMEEQVKSLQYKPPVVVDFEDVQPSTSPSTTKEGTHHVNERSTKLISLVSVYLSVQHAGASLEDVASYVVKTDSSYTKEEVEGALVNSHHLFTASPSNLWRFRLFFQ